MWRQSITRLVGKQRIQEITTASAKSVCELIQSESKLKPEGFDPREIFTLGTLNVVSDFTFGKKYELNDPEFDEIAVAVEGFFNNIISSIKFRLVMGFLPLCITDTKLFYFITQSMISGISDFQNALYGERGLFRAILRQVHEHEKSMDAENPRDYAGMYKINLILIFFNIY